MGRTEKCVFYRNKRNEDPGPCQGSTPESWQGLRGLSVWVTKKPRPRNPQCLSFPPPTYGTDGAQLQKMKGPFQFRLRCLNSSSVDLWWEEKQQEWDWSSLQPTVIWVQKGIQLGFQVTLDNITMNKAQTVPSRNFKINMENKTRSLYMYIYLGVYIYMYYIS